MSPKKTVLPSGEIRWSVRYRDPSGRQPQRRFRTRSEAVQFEAQIRTKMAAGAYVDPREQRQTFRLVAERHWAAHSHGLAEDTTRPRKRSALDRHILPTLGDVPIGALKRSTISAAVATWSKTLAPGTVGQALRQVRQILDTAVDDGLIAANPAKARTVRAPSAPRRRDTHLTDEDVATLVAAASDDWRPLAVALAGLGLRVSEACGLRVADIDFLRRTVRVRHQRRPGGELGKLKTASSERDIPASDVVLEALAEQIRRVPRVDLYVFSSTTGRALTKAICGHVFDDLEGKVGTEVSPHSLRHYFGSSLISRGVNVVAVSAWLGHSDPSITYRVYAYLMPSDEDAGPAAMRAIGDLRADSCAISLPSEAAQDSAAP
jgi:integrase